MRTIKLLAKPPGNRTSMQFSILGIPDDYADNLFRQLEPLVGKEIGGIKLEGTETELKALWRAAVVDGKTELGFADWLEKEVS